MVGSSRLNAKKEKEDMATIRPKSPRPVVIKGEKDESIWDKIGTLGRKKRIKEGDYSLLILMSFSNITNFYIWSCIIIWVRCGQ